MLPLRGRRLFLGFALAALAVSCEKQPLLAPTGSSITLTTTSNALSANGSLPIVAQVIEASGFPPHSGTQVTFITTLGQIQPAEAQTDVNGQVTATFFAGGQNGTATITAISGGVNTGTSGALKIFVGTAAVGAVSIGANPLTLPAGGGSSTISALVLDINGNPLVGSQVTFTTTAGTLSTSLALSNGNGVATTVLTTTAQATVTATVGAQAPAPPTTPTTPTTPAPTATGQASASVTVSVQNAPTITIAPPTTPVQKNIPATFTITVTAATANGAAIKDVIVNWGDGQSQNLGAFTGALPAQHKYESTGTFVVTATVTDVAGNSNSVSSPIVVTSVPGTAVNVNGSVALDAKTVTFTIAITPPTGVGITGASIDYGDGKVDQLGAATAATKVHVYLANGTYQVTVTATDTVGRTTQGSTVVTITGAS